MTADATVIRLRAQIVRAQIDDRERRDKLSAAAKKPRSRRSSKRSAADA
jgi:hypothetical protein